jgi:hypothetical protein
MRFLIFALAGIGLICLIVMLVAWVKSRQHARRDPRCDP